MKVMNELESGFRLIRPKPNPNMTNQPFLTKGPTNSLVLKFEN